MQGGLGTYISIRDSDFSSLRDVLAHDGNHNVCIGVTACGRQLSGVSRMIGIVFTYDTYSFHGDSFLER
jgi:hypothetical protein